MWYSQNISTFSERSPNVNLKLNWCLQLKTIWNPNWSLNWSRNWSLQLEINQNLNWSLKRKNSQNLNWNLIDWWWAEKHFRRSNAKRGRCLLSKWYSRKWWYQKCAGLGVEALKKIFLYFDVRLSAPRIYLNHWKRFGAHMNTFFRILTSYEEVVGNGSENDLKKVFEDLLENDTENRQYKLDEKSVFYWRWNKPPIDISSNWNSCVTTRRSSLSYYFFTSIIVSSPKPLGITELLGEVVLEHCVVFWVLSSPEPNAQKHRKTDK